MSRSRAEHKMIEYLNPLQLFQQTMEKDYYNPVFLGLSFTEKFATVVVSGVFCLHSLTHGVFRRDKTLWDKLVNKIQKCVNKYDLMGIIVDDNNSVKNIRKLMDNLFKKGKFESLKYTCWKDDIASENPTFECNQFGSLYWGITYPVKYSRLQKCSKVSYVEGMLNTFIRVFNSYYMDNTPYEDRVLEMEYEYKESEDKDEDSMYEDEDEDEVEDEEERKDKDKEREVSERKMDNTPYKDKVLEMKDEDEESEDKDEDSKDEDEGEDVEDMEGEDVEEMEGEDVERKDKDEEREVSKRKMDNTPYKDKVLEMKDEDEESEDKDEDSKDEDEEEMDGEDVEDMEGEDVEEMEGEDVERKDKDEEREVSKRKIIKYLKPLQFFRETMERDYCNPVFLGLSITKKYASVAISYNDRYHSYLDARPYGAFPRSKTNLDKLVDMVQNFVKKYDLMGIIVDDNNSIENIHNLMDNQFKKEKFESSKYTCWKDDIASKNLTFECNQFGSFYWGITYPGEPSKQKKQLKKVFSAVQMLQSFLDFFGTMYMDENEEREDINLKREDSKRKMDNTPYKDKILEMEGEDVERKDKDEEREVSERKKRCKTL